MSRAARRFHQKGRHGVYTRRYSSRAVLATRQRKNRQARIAAGAVAVPAAI